MNEINDLIDGYIIHTIYSTIIYNKVTNQTIFDYCNYYHIDYNSMMNNHHTKLKMIDYIIQYSNQTFYTNIFQNDYHISNELLLKYYIFCYIKSNQKLIDNILIDLEKKLLYNKLIFYISI
jgi:hypothetical protein